MPLFRQLSFMVRAKGLAQALAVGVWHFSDLNSTFRSVVQLIYLFIKVCVDIVIYALKTETAEGYWTFFPPAPSSAVFSFAKNKGTRNQVQTDSEWPKKVLHKQPSNKNIPKLSDFSHSVKTCICHTDLNSFVPSVYAQIYSALRAQTPDTWVSAANKVPALLTNDTVLNLLFNMCCN